MMFADIVSASLAVKQYIAIFLVGAKDEPFWVIRVVVDGNDNTDWWK